MCSVQPFPPLARKAPSVRFGKLPNRNTVVNKCLLRFTHFHSITLTWRCSQCFGGGKGRYFISRTVFHFKDGVSFLVRSVSTMCLCRALASACAIMSAIHLVALAAAAPSLTVTQPLHDSLLRTPFLNVTFGQPTHEDVAKRERAVPHPAHARPLSSPCSPQPLPHACSFRCTRLHPRR